MGLLDLRADMATISCQTCGLYFMVPFALEKRWRRDHSHFYCPNGHGLVFRADSDVERLRKENDRLRKEKEWAEQATKRADEAATAASKRLSRLKWRARHGVCPCCKRTFRQLARHMASRHPGFKE